VIELENASIGLTTIDARMGQQILGDAAAIPETIPALVSIPATVV
jgi:hypothetical protein